jgi:hypothetical protein
LGLIRFLLFFFLAIVVVRLIKRFLLPLVFRKAGERMFRDMGTNGQKFDSRKEGEVRVEKKADSTEKVEEADYVEYEEI